MQTLLLDIRPVFPDPADILKITAGLVKKQAVEELEQFELDDCHVTGVFTDTKNGMKGVVQAFKWE